MTRLLQDAFRAALAFAPAGERSGNLTVGSGRLDGRVVLAALVENHLASGALGALECERLAALLRVGTRECTPVALFIDSAGARVSEGLKALGGFRALYRAGLDAALAGTPLAAALGRNCFGGASMLAHLATRRLFSPSTRLAMSGPAILAATAGMNPLDEMFTAMAEASISAPSRARASAANSVAGDDTDVAAWLREALAPRDSRATSWLANHRSLETRLATTAGGAAVAETVRRRDLDRIYPAGYEVREVAGVLAGVAQGAEGPETILGLVGTSPLGAARAWRFAEAAWVHAAAAPPRLRVFLDCGMHATRLDDEKIVLSEYIVDMAFALEALAARGTRVEMTVLGKAGGGVYVALAAPVHTVSAVHGAHIQVLPGTALAAILGEGGDTAPQAAEYLAAGIAESELKLGLLP